MKFCYFTLTSSIPPRDQVYLAGLREQGVEIITCTDATPGWRKFLNLYRKHRALPLYDVLFIGYSAHILVPFARLISRKKIIFNACNSLYEGIILSRAGNRRYSLKALWCLVIDFLDFHLAHITLVETELQRRYVTKTFFVPERKLVVALTGTNEKEFFADPEIPKAPQFTVTFRGAFLPESGVDTLIKAIRLLADEAIHFRIIGTGMLAHQVQELLATFDHQNVEWIQERVPIGTLRRLLQESHLCLGQLADHERLQRTIPHKAFECLAMGLPYLTARNPGVLELLRENETCFCFNAGDANDLARKIRELSSAPDLLQHVGRNGSDLFQTRLRANHLVGNLLATLSRQGFFTK